MTKGTVEQKGRVRYVEPTNFFAQQDGSLSDAINYPYEDYSMAIDLSIRTANRYSCGWGNSSGEDGEITYSSKNGTISFLGGTRGYESMSNRDDSYLTVNYTDISLTDPETNTSECLGIESISITYDKNLFPQVTIKFVDVRGGTVFSGIEKEYYNSKDAGNTSEIYSIFFISISYFYIKG